MRLCMEKSLMRKKQPYLNHLKSKDDLVTPYEATRAGFVSLALEKNRKATPFIAEARALKAEALKAPNPQHLLTITSIRSSLLTATGISEKAEKHLQEEDKIKSIKGLIEKFLEPSGSDFVEELVYRFLLTKGDQLGGSMRNLGGTLGERKLARAIISSLNLSKIVYKWHHTKSKKWVLKSDDDFDIELHLNGLSWKNSNGIRTLIFNRNIPLVKKNVDLSILKSQPDDVNSTSKSAHLIPENYIAFGELKGGIDPAGADEHWKTANSALNRIRESFAKKSLNPITFFIGAAIENSMSEEIFSQLKSGILTNAANLTNDDQVASLCNWLITI
ncbi:MAG: restriction endonuclease [Candidatus Marinimicrobia bacterium]|nr:restriction endonuclease [Candidatus Neomarinimicrobiota bacterium]